MGITIIGELYTGHILLKANDVFYTVDVSIEEIQKAHFQDKESWFRAGMFVLSTPEKNKRAEAMLINKLDQELSFPDEKSCLSSGHNSGSSETADKIALMQKKISHELKKIRLGMTNEVFSLELIYKVSSLSDYFSSLCDKFAKDEIIFDISKKPIDKCSECAIVRVEDEQRADADDDGLQFITVNGAHVPLVEGKAVGGPLKGEDFSESKPVKASGRKTGSKKSKSSKKPSESSQKPEYNGGQGKKEGNSTSPSKKQSQPAPTKPSPYSGNARTTGFINSAELDDHFARHNKSLGCSSKKEYQEKGIDLLTKPCTNGIAGYARADGKVVRFNTKTGEYVSGYPGQNLCTYMIPKDNNGVDLSKALAYYNKHRLEDEKRYGMLKQDK